MRAWSSSASRSSPTKRSPQAEAGWLCERIGRDGRLTPNEAALVGYLKKESPKIHPDLQAAVERLAQAA